MIRQLLIMCSILATLTAMSRDFQYTYEGQTLTYTVLDLEAKTCATKAGSYSHSGNSAGNQVSGALIIPATASDGRHSFTVTKIDDSSFLDCVGMTSVSIPKSVTTIGYEAFRGCTGLNSVIIPNSVTEMSNYAFCDCSGLTEVVISSSLNWIECGVFERCTGLTSVTIPPSVTSILSEAFADCSSLEEIEFPNSLTYLGGYAFSGCTALKSVILPPSIEKIRDWAFKSDSNLYTIIMGPNLIEISSTAFEECPASNVYITAQTPPAITGSGNLFNNSSGKLYVQGEDVIDKYYYAENWGNYEIIAMIEPTELILECDKVITGKPGDTFQLSAKLYPEDVALPYIFWRSTNPAVATVDSNGLVTIQATPIENHVENEDPYARTCKIIAETLYADGPTVEIIVNDSTSGVEGIMENAGDGISFDATVEVYNLQGIKASESSANLSRGFYIVRQGSKVKKIMVK